MYSKQYLVIALLKQTAETIVCSMFCTLERRGQTGQGHGENHLTGLTRIVQHGRSLVLCSLRDTPAVSEGPDAPSRTALRPLFLSSRPQERCLRLASKKAVPRHTSCGFKINSLSNELHHLPTAIRLLFERDDVAVPILRPWPHGLKLHGLKVGLGVPLQHVLPLAVHLHDVQHGEPAFLRVPVQLPQEFL